MSGFHYSTLNYDLAKSTPSGSLNILWNSLNTAMQADSIMHITPNFDPTIGYNYPEFGTWGNQLLNPCLAIQQAMNSFQNGSWMNGLFGIGNFGFTPWQSGNNGNMFGGWSPWGSNNNGATGGTAGNSEYDALKALINKYKEIGVQNKTLSPEALDKINKALNKSGSTEEKMQTLKDLYKSLSKSKLEKAMLELPEYKEALLGAGYKFNGTNKKGDSELEKELSSLAIDIKAKNGDKLTQMFNSSSDAQILRKISYWNDKHSDSTSRGVIRLVANNIDTKTKDELKLQQEGIKNIVESLIAKAADMDGNFPKLDAAKDGVSDKLVVVETDGKFTKGNLMKLADECDKLYAILRMMEAEKVRNDIKVKYSFLNNISSTDTDFVNDNLVKKSTIEDLKNEGITIIPDIDNIPVEEQEVISDIDDKFDTSEEKVEELLGKGNLTKSAKDGVYKTKTTSTNEPAHFYLINDEKLVEIKGVKAIDKNGNCSMLDGSTRKLAEISKDAIEVSGQDIIDYQTTINKVDKLVKDGNLVKCKYKNIPAGVQVYRSKGKKEDGYFEFYVVRNNKLMKIDCVTMSTNGWIMKEIGDNSKSKLYKNLTDDDFIEADTINTEDLKANKATEAAEAERKAAEEKKAEAEAVVDKEYLKPEKVDTAYSNGEKVADLLMRNTDDEEWGRASTLILKRMNKDNVHSFVEAYAKEEGIGTDNILEQIATEYESTGFLGIGSKKRSATDRLKLINYIIKTVLEHCEEYGVKDEYAYNQLKEKYNGGKGITEKMINDEATSTIRKFDKWILELLDIKD